MRQTILVLLLVGVSGGATGLFPFEACAQAPGARRVQLPTTSGWNEVREGETLEFSLSTPSNPESSNQYSYQFASDTLPGMRLDPSGTFTWQPNYDVTGPNEQQRTVAVRFAVRSPSGQTATQAADLVVYNQPRIPPPTNLPPFFVKQQADNEYQLVLLPDFVEPGDTGTYRITFFVMDRTNQRQERQVSVTVQDAENLVEKDQLLYRQYRTGLMRIWDLMAQLQEKEKELSRSYRRARRGKKHRVLTTASIGAITGLSPVVLSNDVTSQQYVSGVGGTASMTLGSLEAGKVIGKDPSSIYEKLSYINQKLNELQTQGNLFAGKYALSASRRSAEFGEDLKKLILLLKVEKVTDLELDASWKNPKKASDKNIQNTFRDFNPDPDKSSQINE